MAANLYGNAMALPVSVAGVHDARLRLVKRAAAVHKVGERRGHGPPIGRAHDVASRRDAARAAAQRVGNHGQEVPRRYRVASTLLKVQSEIRKGWGDLVTIQLFSAPKRMGLEEAYTVLAGWMELADKGAEAATEAE